jgi:hypothetical protein
MVRPTNMERSCKLIRRLRLPGGTLSDEELACAVRPHAACRKIAAHTRAATAERALFASAIADPVLRSIYRASRKKALA